MIRHHSSLTMRAPARTIVQTDRQTDRQTDSISLLIFAA